MFSRKQKARIKEIQKSVDEADKTLNKQAPHVNAVSSWLKIRANQNGFGADFEYTLRPKGAR